MITTAAAAAARQGYRRSGRRRSGTEECDRHGMVSPILLTRHRPLPFGKSEVERERGN